VAERLPAFESWVSKLWRAVIAGTTAPSRCAADDEPFHRSGVVATNGGPEDKRVWVSSLRDAGRGRLAANMGAASPARGEGWDASRKRVGGGRRDSTRRARGAKDHGFSIGA
jgi:hypothetical protein